MFAAVRLAVNICRSTNYRINIFDKETSRRLFNGIRNIEMEKMSEHGKDKSEVCQRSFEDEHLQEYLDEVADILEVSNPKYVIKPGSKTGDNYVAVVYRIFIEGEKNGMPVKAQAIFKVPPTDEVTRKAMLVGSAFPREDLFYSEIVPVFKKFLEEKNKTLENIPECYLSSPEDHKEVICLEDLRPKGFVMRDRMKQMDFPHISLALRALGRLHALSFVLRDQKPDIFAKKIASLPESLYKPEVIADARFIERFQQLGDLVKTALATENPWYTERFSAYAKNGLSRMQWCCTGSSAEPYGVLCHGDFWMNNMLFKYDKGNKEPEDVYFLDFQLARYASPVIDISYVLFCNCSQELRSKYYDELMKIYHESLSVYLTELGSDPEKMFPFDALLVQLQKFSNNAAGMATLVLPMFTSQGEDEKSFNPRNNYIAALQERIHRDHFWRNTTRDTFKNLIDRNYI